MCQVCQKAIKPEDKFIKDYLKTEEFGYHVACHLTKFGDLQEIEETLVAQNKMNNEQKVGYISNITFLVILTFIVALGFGVILWMVI